MLPDGTRVVRVIGGSDSDLLQMRAGSSLLDAAVTEGRIDWDGIHTISIHWNTLSVLAMMIQWHQEGVVDVIIIGAGAANHITGTCDAFLRRTLGNDHIVVLGVAFEGGDTHPTWGETAERSIVDVPGTQVVYNGYRGSHGFTEACKFAIKGDLPTIELPKQMKLPKFYPREQALIATGAKSA